MKPRRVGKNNWWRNKQSIVSELLGKTYLKSVCTDIGHKRLQNLQDCVHVIDMSFGDVDFSASMVSNEDSLSKYRLQKSELELKNLNVRQSRPTSVDYRTTPTQVVDKYRKLKYLLSILLFHIQSPTYHVTLQEK